MDVNHVNWIGKQLDCFDKQPCCTSQGLAGPEHFEPNPSRLTYAQLVDELPCFRSADPNADKPLPSRKDCRAPGANYDNFRASAALTSQQNISLAAFRTIHTSVCQSSGPTLVSLADLEQFAVCFDDFLFEGWIMERCSIEWSTSLPDINAGRVDCGNYCGKHQQCHTMRILLREPSPCSDPEERRSRLDHLLGLLLHELCYAYVCMFADWRARSIEDALTEHGPAAHGVAWEYIMKMCCWVASDYFGFEVDEATWLEYSADAETEVMYKMEQLNEWIQYVRPGPDVLDRRIALDLIVSVAHARKYHLLREKGLGSLEAITLIWGTDLVLLCQPETRKLIPEGWYYRSSAFDQAILP